MFPLFGLGCQNILQQFHHQSSHILSMLNKYIIRSRISEAKFREIIRFFCLDLEAKKIAEISGVD
jgi:hypothetical protein